MMLPERSCNILIFAHFNWQVWVRWIDVFRLVPAGLFLFLPEIVEWEPSLQNQILAEAKKSALQSRQRGVFKDSENGNILKLKRSISNVIQNQRLPFYRTE